MKKIISNLLVVAAVFGGMNSSKAGLLTWDSTAPSQIIPDNQPNSGLASDISIAASDPKLASILNPYVASISSVKFTIVGGWAGDFTVALKYTDGATSVSSTLFSSLQGGAAANGGFSSVMLTTGTGPSITTAGSTTSTAPIMGTYSGVNFSMFQNLSPTGDWILYFTDNQTGDQGTLTDWSLEMDVVPEPVNVALGVFGGVLGLVALKKKLKFAKQS